MTTTMALCYQNLVSWQLPLFSGLAFHMHNLLAENFENENVISAWTITKPMSQQTINNHKLIRVLLDLLFFCDFKWA